MTLVPVDPTNEASVITLLERAATWLSEAVHRGDPADVAMVKAQLATAAEATKQLNLSKEIQEDAVEMVRRAEYALGKAIRRGQAEGTVYAPGKNPGPSHDYMRNGQVIRGGVSQKESSSAVPVTEFAPRSELYNDKGNIMQLAEASPEQFDSALEEARDEGNLSRANVVRKIKGGAGVVTRDMRAEMIRDLAEQGYSSRQMPKKVGVTEETVRQIARDFGIEIPADKVVGKSRRLNHTQMVEQTVIALSNEVDALKYIDFAEVDFSEADEWVASLNQSISKLRKFANRIKETTHVV